MRKSTFIPAALAAAGLLACAGSAHALATATASLSNFQVQVFDLDLLDGITASVTFASGAQVYATATDGTSVSNFDFNMAGTALSVSALFGNASSSGSTTTGDFFAPGSGPGASASASVFGVGTQAYGYGSVLSSNFTLSAKTLLIFSASTSGITATRTLAGETAQGYASVNLNDNNNSQSSYGQSITSVGDNSNYSNLNPLIQASFVNLTAADVTGYAGASASAYVIGAPIPEPETYALMLAGLLAIGLVARRRNTHTR